MRYLFDLAYLLAVIAISPKVIYRMLRHKRYRTGWAQRLGKISLKNPDKKCIWLHAVSVGEVNAAKTLIAALANQLPDYQIAVSTTTDTGFAQANSIFSDKATVFYFPLDFSFTMKRAFKNINPAICLLMELEVWPNLISIAKQRKIPVVVVNGRISDKSFPKYRLIKPIIKRIFKQTTLILAQTDEYAKRFRALGTPQQIVSVTGSLKYDTAQITDRIEGADILAEKLNINENQRLWVAGATGNDEEVLLIKIYMKLIAQEKFKSLRLAIIPRKPERFDEAAQLISQFGLPMIRYSQIKDNPAPPKTDSRTVILGDTMGDLRKFYSLATVIFVGRSLVPMGGSDRAEAAALGRCTIFGPYTFNFKQTVDDLLKDNGAIQVTNEQQLLEIIEKCLCNPAFAKEIARNGQNVIRKNQGATKRTIEQIKNLLSKQTHSTKA
jgi:3-deoxy-D-manno-octulosonic-acid transferase